MTKSINDVSLLDIMPQSLLDDHSVKALAMAIDQELQGISSEINLCLIWSRIDELPEDVIDLLAWHLHIDWYDSAADISIKRQLVKSATRIHQQRGTPAAVEEIIQTYFGDGYVQEWFEYGGDPYRFKVISSNASITAELANQFIAVLNSVKNTRSHLESILIALSGDMDLYFAGVVHTGDFLEIRQVI